MLEAAYAVAVCCLIAACFACAELRRELRQALRELKEARQLLLAAAHRIASQSELLFRRAEGR